MIQTEEIIINNRKLIHTWSDSNKKIKQIETGKYYEDAIDIIPYSYEETNIDIEAEGSIEDKA